MNRRLLGCFIVAQLVDLSAISDLAVNDGMEGLGESAETLVDGLPLRCGEVDTVVNFVPQGTCRGVLLATIPYVAPLLLTSTTNGRGLVPSQTLRPEELSFRKAVKSLLYNVKASVSESA